jgi:hypothetical protein
MFNPLKHEFLLKNPVRTSRETHYFSITKTNRLMLFREIMEVYSQNHAKHVNTPCGQNAGLFNATGGGTYSNHCALEF